LERHNNLETSNCGVSLSSLSIYHSSVANLDPEVRYSGTVKCPICTSSLVLTAGLELVNDPPRVQYGSEQPILEHPKTLLIIIQRDATQSSLFIILQVRSTCFRCQPHPSSGVHKTVTTASGTGQASLATLEGGSCTKI